MRAEQYASDLYNLENPIAAGSLFNGTVDANYGISLKAHKTHGDGMNFDLGIARSFLTGVFLTSQAVAGNSIDTSALTAPAAGGWSNQYAYEVSNQLAYGTNTLGDLNYQRDAMRDFLSVYSVTRNNGAAEANGWDDLIAQVATGSTQAQKERIRTALFGDGTAAGSIVSGALVGGDKNKVIKGAKNNYNLEEGSKQAELLRMGEVLNALGISGLPQANAIHNVKDHFNHFHVY
ncbi:MAG: hypothetical protein R8M11_02535, partial [Gallionella sp.]